MASQNQLVPPHSVMSEDTISAVDKYQ